MVWYLKIDRQTKYVMRNLQRWLDVISFDELSTVFILCDKEELCDKVQEKVQYDGILNFIKSNRDEAHVAEISNAVLDHHWMKCGQAHLTTFIHSKLMGYEDFWNIDADDTFFCLSPKRTYQLLKRAAEKAIEKGQHITSLDMHYSESDGVHWTFGVTYTRNDVDWVHIMKKHLYDEERKSFLPELPINLDTYFTYINTVEMSIGFGTFAANNLRFIHDADDVWSDIDNCGLLLWKNNTIFWPIRQAVLSDTDDRAYKSVPIDMDMLDSLMITDDESLSELRKLSHRKKPLIQSEQVVLWGTGDWYKRNIDFVKKRIHVDKVIDTDSRKWGQFTDEGLEIVSPDYLFGKDHIVIIVMLRTGIYIDQVFSRLDRLGIQNYGTFDEWYRSIKE